METTFTMNRQIVTCLGEATSNQVNMNNKILNMEMIDNLSYMKYGNAMPHDMQDEPIKFIYFPAIFEIVTRKLILELQEREKRLLLSV